MENQITEETKGHLRWLIEKSMEVSDAISTKKSDMEIGMCFGVLN